MKITKSQLKQIIKEEVESDEALLDALHKLTAKIDDLDVSVDYLASAVTGEDAHSIGSAQRGLGRFSKPMMKVQQKGSDLEEAEEPAAEHAGRALDTALTKYALKAKKMIKDDEAGRNQIVDSLWNTMMASLSAAMPGFRNSAHQRTAIKNLLKTLTPADDAPEDEYQGFQTSSGPDDDPTEEPTRDYFGDEHAARGF